MYDSFNIGECISSNGNTSGIIHKVSADSDISRCINYGKGWSNNLYNDIHPTASINDNYYYKVNSDGETIGGSTSLSKLCKEGALNNFDYSSTYARWYVAGKEGYFAIPFKSQMQEESTLKIAE